MSQRYPLSSCNFGLKHRISILEMQNLFLILFLISGLVKAQSTFPFDIVLEAVNVTGAPGLQSYSKAENNGDWLILGGRTDGLHQRQPWQAFDAAGHHLNAVVINPDSSTVHWAPLSGLNNDTLEAQLSATNANFTQVGDYLYIVGGYGLSAGEVHITHPVLTVIDVPSAIASIKSTSTLDSSDFAIFSDEDFAVTGGKLMHLNSTFWLIGGHRFDGQYNPMGHNTYTQIYTEEILPFTVNGTFPNLTIAKLDPIEDTDELHRRDYNVTYMTDGSDYYFNIWSGVFQKTANLPYLNAVEIHDTTLTSVPNFSQYLNHYHCPSLSLYGHDQSAMYTVFFGGIAQYYYSNGIMIQDNDVPFVNTIGIVEKQGGSYSETKSSTTMPGLFGAGAEFFLNEALIQNHHILEADSIGTDTTWAGYIYGGISSPAANVFFGGMTNQSSASSTIYRVGLVRNSDLSLNEELPKSTLELLVAPNPSKEHLMAQFKCQEGGVATYRVLTIEGKMIAKGSQRVEGGKNLLNLGHLNAAAGNYILQINAVGQSQQIQFKWN